MRHIQNAQMSISIRNVVVNQIICAKSCKTNTKSTTHHR